MDLNQILKLYLNSSNQLINTQAAYQGKIDFRV